MAFAYVWWMPNDVAMVPPDKGKRRGKATGQKAGGPDAFAPGPLCFLMCHPGQRLRVGLN